MTEYTMTTLNIRWHNLAALAAQPTDSRLIGPRLTGAGNV
jgi:hypothetical protein